MEREEPQGRGRRVVQLLDAVPGPGTQRVQVSVWYILIGYFGGLRIYHNDTWTLWGRSREPGRFRVSGFKEPRPSKTP